MRVITLLGLMALILVIMVSGAVGYVTFFVDTGPDNTQVEEIRQACSEFQGVQCDQRGSISEQDYPQDCFIDGEHVLDDPYTCPG